MAHVDVSSLSVSPGLSTWSSRLIPPQPPQKTPLTMATLEIDCDLKGVGYNDHEQHHKHKDPRPFRVPHNYQQYQQTILSRSFTTFTDVSDKLLPICVRGEKIEGPQPQPDEEAHPQNGSQEPELDDNFQMMNERGETNISFYDFQRTWSIENYEPHGDDDDGEGDEDDDEEGKIVGDRRRRRLSASDGCDNKTSTGAGRYQHRRFFRTPSPKTKQVIRVNVVRVANS